MRTRTSWLAFLLTAGMAMAPTGVRAQEVPPADPVIPLPLYHDRPEKGGFYTAAEFMYWRQTNPIKQQQIAVRGLLDFDGSITADLNGTLLVPAATQPVIIPGQTQPGAFLGSASVALDADQVSGPGSYQPGWRLTAGWRFQDGMALEFSWMSLVEAKYNAVASLVPPTLNPGPILAESFLFSPVFNFPNSFAGQAFKLALGNPFAAYGIWNGANVMTIQFVQRYTQYDITSRVPVFQADYCRCYGLVGFRYVNMFERFSWRTVSEDFQGRGGQDDVAIYSNVVSNQLYGPDMGIGTEWYFGHGFSMTLEGRAGLMMDFVHKVVKYERADFATAAKRGARDYTLVPELDGKVNLWWYPFEGVQVRIGYDLMGFFNTISSPRPVDFNFGSLTPGYQRTFRGFDGFEAGIGFIF